MNKNTAGDFYVLASLKIIELRNVKIYHNLRLFQQATYEC